MAGEEEKPRYGRQREWRWTPTRAKAQDTRANPNSWETHLVRKRWEHWTPTGVESKDYSHACVTMFKNFQVKIAQHLIVFDLIRI